MVVQATQSNPANRSSYRQERPQASRQWTPRSPTRQETYKVARCRAEFKDRKIIKFIVNGREGIRLSDALEGNWAGFEGRDDRSLFGGDRLQIMIRLQVRDPISIRRDRLRSLTFPSSSSAVHLGNQR